MLIKYIKQCEEFVAADGSILRELLHPDKADLKIGYSLAHAKLAPGEATTPHRLKSSEVYYILKGEGVMHIDKEREAVNARCAIYIPPHARQYIENSGDSDLEFLCLVDPAWRSEDEEICSL